MKSTRLAVAAKPVGQVVPLQRPRARRGDELAFLPAALEIVETPPSPVGRAVAFTLMGFFCIALAWAWWGTIDIVATATGKVVPSSRTKVIQPFETGVVREIRVQDGQQVRAGDVLIELDPTMNAAERDHLLSDLLAEQLNIARLRAALAGGNDPLADFVPPAAAEPVLVAAQRQLLSNQVSEHRAKLAALDRQQAQKQSEVATTTATIEKLEALIPVIQPRVDMRKSPDGPGPRLQAHLLRDAPAAGRATEGAGRAEEPPARSRGRGGGDPRGRALRPRRNGGATGRTISPRPSRRPRACRRI